MMINNMIYGILTSAAAHPDAAAPGPLLEDGALDVDRLLEILGTGPSGLIIESNAYYAYFRRSLLLLLRHHHIPEVVMRIIVVGKRRAAADNNTHNKHNDNNTTTTTIAEKDDMMITMTTMMTFVDKLTPEDLHHRYCYCYDDDGPTTTSSTTSRQTITSWYIMAEPLWMKEFAPVSKVYLNYYNSLKNVPVELLIQLYTNGLSQFLNAEDFYLSTVSTTTTATTTNNNNNRTAAACEHLEYVAKGRIKNTPEDSKEAAVSSSSRLCGGGGEQGYLALLREVSQEEGLRADRTGTGTLSVFGRQLRFDLAGDHFPMLTTRRVSFKIVLHELLWFITGRTDARALQERGVNIWTANTARAFLDARGLHGLPEGDIGPGYGFQWRHYGAEYGTCRDDYTDQGVDQLEEVLRLLKTDPHSRRICMTAWNPAALPRMALPPCHSCFVQFFVDGNGGLSCHMYQRSVDCFLGLAMNVPSYALLTHIIAAKCDLTPRELIVSTGDTHIYSNHVEQVREQLQRQAMPPPRLLMDIESVKRKAWSELTEADFGLVGYQAHPVIRAPMAV
jgi:thymidylate synthase